MKIKNAIQIATVTIAGKSRRQLANETLRDQNRHIRIKTKPKHRQYSAGMCQDRASKLVTKINICNYGFIVSIINFEFLLRDM